jgi:hypothetical protein
MRVVAMVVDNHNFGFGVVLAKPIMRVVPMSTGSFVVYVPQIGCMLFTFGYNFVERRFIKSKHARQEYTTKHNEHDGMHDDTDPLL